MPWRQYTKEALLAIGVRYSLGLSTTRYEENDPFEGNNTASGEYYYHYMLG